MFWRRKKTHGRSSQKGRGPPKRGGQTLNRSNRIRGLRNRRYRRDSEYRLAPRRPWRETPRGDGSPFPRGRDRPYRPPFAPISMETPVLPQTAESVGEREAGSTCAQSPVTKVDAGEAFMASQEDSVGVLDSGATANLVCCSCLAHQKRILERHGIPRVTAYPARARFRFEEGRLGEVRQAADIPLGVAGN